jgi:putative transposase
MGKPYSIDLRERAVAAVEEEGLSRHEAAWRFSVAVSTVVNWVRRYRETGSVAPGQMGGHKPKAIQGEHEAWLRHRLGSGISRCAASSPSSPRAASRSVIVRSGTSSRPRS